MKSRSSLLILAVGLLAGSAFGYAAGRWSAVPVGPGPLAIALPPTGDPAPISRSPVGFGLPDTQPAGVFKGMSRARAAANLTVQGFEAWTDDSVSDRWERYRKPWWGGYHYVSLRFDSEVVAEFGESWVDP